jgi:hypothetical protein
MVGRAADPFWLNLQIVRNAGWNRGATRRSAVAVAMDGAEIMVRLSRGYSRLSPPIRTSLSADAILILEEINAYS